MTNVEYHGCLVFQGDRTDKDAEETRNGEAEEGAGSKKPHANAAKRNSNKFSPKLEEIQEEARKRVGENKKQKSSPTFEIPPSLDSGIVTRSVSSHSQSNDDDYNDQSDEESDRDNTETEDEEEFLSKDDLRMFGKTRGRQKPSGEEEDIVSDMYSTAFSKVPKVGHDLTISQSLIRDHCQDNHHYHNHYHDHYQVLPSDTESVYSLTSTVDRDFDYDSLGGIDGV